VATGEPISLPRAADAAAEALADPLADGLVGYWKLDEALATAAAVDATGQGNVGTPVPLQGPPVASSVPPVRLVDPASRSFDGVSQYLDLGNPDILNFEGPITLAAWVKLAAVTDNCGTIISHGYRTDPAQEVALRLGALSTTPCDTGIVPTQAWAAGSYDGADHFAKAALESADFGAWVHLAGTYDGSAWHLFRNGVEIASYAFAVGALRVDAPWSIGARAPSNPAAASRFFSGLIDEVRVYRRGLSPAEVLELYHR